MKKIFATLTGLIIVLLITGACKKSNTTTSTPSSTTTANQAPVADYGGWFQVNNLFNDNTLFPGNLNDSSCKPSLILIAAANIGTVSINTNTLTLQYNSSYNLINIIAPLYGKATWQVSGGSGFGAFTYTTTKNIPAFTNLHLSLNSISLSNNLVITHPLILADSIKYTITDYYNNSVTKTVANSSAGVTFTTAAMGALIAANTGSIKIIGTNIETSIQGGKSINFINSATYNKVGIAIN